MFCMVGCGVGVGVEVGFGGCAGVEAGAGVGVDGGIGSGGGGGTGVEGDTSLYAVWLYVELEVGVEAGFFPPIIKPMTPIITISPKNEIDRNHSFLMTAFHYLLLLSALVSEWYR